LASFASSCAAILFAANALLHSGSQDAQDFSATRCD
jgi:hypothetical protein